MVCRVGKRRLVTLSQGVGEQPSANHAFLRGQTSAGVYVNLRGQVSAGVYVKLQGRTS